MAGGSDSEELRQRTPYGKTANSKIGRFAPVALLLALLGPFLASTWYTLALERRTLEESFEYEVNRLADNLAQGMIVPVHDDAPTVGRALLDSLLRDDRVLRVAVTSVAHGAFLEGGTKPQYDKRPVVVLTRDVVYGGTRIGDISMTVDASSMHRAMDSQRVQTIAVETGTVVLSLAIVMFVFRVSSRLENEANLRIVNRKLRAEVAERITTEARLRESQARIKGIMENSPSAIFLKDTNGRYQLVNPRVCEWYGLSEEQIIGKTTAEIFPGSYAEDYMAHDRAVLEEDCAITREHEMPWIDGSIHTVVSTKFPVRDTGGTLKGIGTIFTDITDNRRAAETIRQAQKMQSLGQLTGGVAHDFNNLLAVILGNAEMLDEDIPKKTEEQEKSLRSIYRAVQRGKELSMRLLAFSRRQPLSPMPVDMHELADGMTELLRRTLGAAIRVRMEPVHGDGLALADPGQLENAILNLGINARDAMPGGGEITISSGRVMIRDEADAAGLDLALGDYVTISVRDTGFGMPPDIVERAVEPFFTTKDVGEGAGLGLSMVYGFVKQSAGGMQIESREGEGTKVTLYLPCAPEGALVADERAVSDAPLGSGETILVVEDDADLRRVARSMLESLGYQVVAAEDARDGMAKLASDDRIVLMLSDVVLPGGFSGLDLAEAALVQRPDLKVVFMSGFTDRGARGQPLPSGAKLITKPFERRTIARLLSDELAAKPVEVQA